MVKRLLTDMDKAKEEISISRAYERLKWGVRVPGDDTQTIYVWLDALVNYLTVAGYPEIGLGTTEFIHIIGKDIAKFHCYYWPAFLLGANLPLPSLVKHHGHWLKDKVIFIIIQHHRQKCPRA